MKLIQTRRSRKLRLPLVRRPLLALRCPRKCQRLRRKLGVQAKYSALERYVTTSRDVFAFWFLTCHLLP